MVNLHLVSIERDPLHEWINDALPTDAFQRGYRLEWFNPDCYRYPVILFRHGLIVSAWEYIPSMLEVWDKIEELESPREGC